MFFLGSMSMRLEILILNVLSLILRLTKILQAQRPQQCLGSLRMEYASVCLHLTNSPELPSLVQIHTPTTFKGKMRGTG